MTIHITPREKEIIEWLSGGKTTAEISEILGCGKTTVETHKRAIMDKFGAANVTSMVVMALRKGLVS